MTAKSNSTTSDLLADYAAFAGRQLPLAFALMIAGAIAEGIGILMLVPLVAVATDVEQVPAALRDLAGLAGGMNESRRFVLALAIFLAAMALRSGLLYARDGLLARLAAGHEASLQLRAAATLATRGWPFASGVGQSGMQSLLLTDIPRAAVAVRQAQAIAVSLVLLAVQLAVAALLSIRMAGVAFAIVAAGLLLSRRWARQGRDSGVAITASYERSSAAGFRLHSGLKAAMAQGTVAAFLTEYRHSLGRLASEIERFSLDQAWARAAAAMAAALAAALLLFVGDRLLGIPFPLLVTLLVLFARMSGPALQLQQSLQGFAAFAPAYAAIGERIGALGGIPAEERGEAQPLDWRELRLDMAAHCHQPGLGLEEASLVLHRGEWLGISGPSGAGKTTLADMAAGLIEPQFGAVKVDGKPLAGDVLKHWRASLAYVGQSEMVFDDSVRDNLLAGGSTAEDSALWEALELVGLGERIRALVEGLDSSVGDRGSQLSGGERQRLALARVVLRRPSLLILDEATSALDEVGERQVLANLRNLEPRPAAILIAHRSSSLQLCDVRLRLESGRLVQA